MRSDSHKETLGSHVLAQATLKGYPVRKIYSGSRFNEGVYMYICVETYGKYYWPRRGRSWDKKEGARGKEKRSGGRIERRDTRTILF